MSGMHEQFETRPTLRDALGWDPEGGTLCGGERALSAKLRVLDVYLDRLDDAIQVAIVDAPNAVATRTAAEKDAVRRILHGQMENHLKQRDLDDSLNRSTP